MTKTVCPKCNTQAYDDTSFFCHACGAPLSVPVQEKKTARDHSFGVKIPKKESGSARDDTPLPRKPGSIKRIMPVECCARCGEPLPDENRMYCARCAAYVRDTPEKEEVQFIHPPVPEAPRTIPEAPRTIPAAPPKISQDTGTFQEQHPAPLKGAEIPLHPKASPWKIIIIIGAIAVLFLMLIMIVMLMFTFMASVS
jgi:ribosomal protein L37E